MPILWVKIGVVRCRFFSQNKSVFLLIFNLSPPCLDSKLDHVIQIRGDSYRLKDKRIAGIIGQQLTAVQIYKITLDVGQS